MSRISAKVILVGRWVVLGMAGIIARITLQGYGAENIIEMIPKADAERVAAAS
jgi:hypothetical protein